MVKAWWLAPLFAAFMLGSSLIAEEEQPELPLWRAVGLRDAMCDPDWHIRCAAVQVIAFERNFGTQALAELRNVEPRIVELRSTKDLRTRLAVEVALIQLGRKPDTRVAQAIGRALEDPVAHYAGIWAATWAADRIGELAEHYIAQLVEAESRSNLNWRLRELYLKPAVLPAYVEFLVEQGFEASLERIGQLLRDSRPAAREAGVEVLARLGGQTEIVPRAVESLSSVHSEEAVAVLVAIGDPAEVAPYIAEGLESTNELARFDAIAALGEIGEPTIYGPRLAEQLQGRDDIAKAAVKALAAMDAPEVTIPLIATVFAHGSYEVRLTAIEVLAKIGAPQEVVPRFVELLENEREREVVHATIDALMAMDQQAVATRECIKLINSPHPNRAAAAIEMLARIAEPQIAVQHIAPVLQRVFPKKSFLTHSPRRFAISALAEVGKPEVVALLIAKLLQDEDGLVRASAIRHLAKIGARADLPPEIMKLLWGKHIHIWISVVEDRPEIRIPAQVIPRITRLLESENFRTRRAAIRVLARVGDPVVVVPKLIHLLSDDESDVRQAAVEAIAVIGDPAVVMRSLVRMLDDDDEDVLQAALESLAQVGNSEVAAEIARLLDHRNYAVRRDAIDALAQTGEPTVYAPQIAALLAVKDVSSRAFSGLITMARRDPNASPWLLEAYLEYPDKTVDALFSLGPLGLPAVAAMLEWSHQREAHRAAMVVLAYECGGGRPIVTASSDRQPYSMSNLTMSHLVYWLAARQQEPAEIRRQLQPDRGSRSVWMDRLRALWAIWDTSTDQHFKLQPDRGSRSVWLDRLRALRAIWVTSADKHFKLQSRIAQRVSEISQSQQNAWRWQDLPLLEDWRRELKNVKGTGMLPSVIRKVKRRHQFSLWRGYAALTLAGHGVFWLGLIFLYPRSPFVQALFFWNPWVRRIAGLGYVGLLLSWIAPLRRLVFRPFRQVLLADAALHEFDPQAFFPDLEVLDSNTGQRMVALDAMPKIQGQILLEGESGLGKSMIVRWLAQRSRRVTVFLPATKCSGGVLEAIAAKLEGVAADKPFLKSLIYNGAMDVCIDGLNEVDPQTVVRISEFVEKFFHGNVILTTQPMHWIPPATARRLQLQPLPENRGQEFLRSREPFLQEDAPVRGRAFVNACDACWEQRHDAAHSDEMKRAIDRTLSNPMDLTSAAELIAQGQTPEVRHLQQQQFEVMQSEYRQQNQNSEFPLSRFAETVYQMRLADEREFDEEAFRNELECLEKHKLVVVRRDYTPSTGAKRRWYFRHDKTLEFFLVQAFLGNQERQHRHVQDPRFRGVYALLADVLDPVETKSLKEYLLRHAVETNDVSTLVPFVKQLDGQTALANSSQQVRKRKPA